MLEIPSSDGIEILSDSHHPVLLISDRGEASIDLSARNRNSQFRIIQSVPHPTWTTLKGSSMSRPWLETRYRLVSVVFPFFVFLFSVQSVPFLHVSQRAPQPLRVEERIASIKCQKGRHCGRYYRISSNENEVSRLDEELRIACQYHNVSM